MRREERQTAHCQAEKGVRQEVRRAEKLLLQEGLLKELLLLLLLLLLL
jgi:hypothetical protein